MSKKNLGKQTRGAGKAPSSSPMDLGLLEQIVKLMAANDLNTVEVRDGEKRVVLKRGPAGQPTLMTAPTVVQNPASPTSGAAPAASAADDTAGLTPIKSPMVGTFYSTPSPDAKPFVVVGSTIDEETDVCIIEAMKVFNNIKAECRGTIAKILVTNGQTVEFGQVLFLVKPA